MREWKTGVGVGALLVALMSQSVQAHGGGVPPLQAATAGPHKAKKVKVRRNPARSVSQAVAESKQSALRSPTRDRARTVTSGSDGSKVTSDGTESDIVVVGIRGSIDSALDRKRGNDQIVDSVVAEDAGKLPDNNVVDALSRITGVNITRSQGQGSSITIRGLSGVQTTVNGQDVAVGDERQISLSDIPAELIKSVDVYKSRGASQPEGGIGGTVNVELRRPLELKKGLLVAGSVRSLYNSVTDKVDPFGSLLVSYRTDTGIGEMGFLVNGSYTRTRYSEPLVESESPFLLFGDANSSLPTELQGKTIAPYKIRYGQNSGRRQQPALTATYQWRPSENLNFIVEGQYFGSRSRDRYAGASLQTREDYLSLTNVTVGPSGAIQKATFSNPARDSEGNGTLRPLPLFINGGESRSHDETLIGNFEAHWHAGIASVDFNAQRQKFVGDSFGIGYSQRYSGATIANVDFNNPVVPGGVPTITLPGTDLADPASAQISGFSDNRRRNTTASWIFAVDTTLRLSENGFLRQFQFGPRYTFRRDRILYGYRDVSFDNDPRPPITALSLPNHIVAPNINGQTPLGFAAIDSAYLLDNFDVLRQQIVALNPSGRGGNGPEGTIADFFGTPNPSFDPTQGGVYRERTFAFYGQVSWGLNLGFPVDGLAGVRYVNTFGGVQGARFVSDPPRADGTCCDPNYYAANNSRANYVDILPSASATWHFDPKLQLRTTYNYNVQRPSFYAIRDAYVYSGNASTNPDARVDAGNPGLKPARDHNFNASLEWFPLAGTSLTAGAFYKKQQGFIYYTAQFEPVPPLGGVIRRVWRERNAGPGEVLGFEFAGSLPFFFMPNVLRPFGVTVNATYIPHAVLSVPDETGGNFVDVRSPGTSELSYNAILYYETGKLSGRLAYNWRSKFKTFFDAITPGNVQIGLPQQRLDAAINYTPVPFLTLSVEGSNLLKNIDRYRYDLYPDLSVGLRSMARTIQGSARFRF